MDRYFVKKRTQMNEDELLVLQMPDIVELTNMPMTNLSRGNRELDFTNSQKNGKKIWNG